MYTISPLDQTVSGPDRETVLPVGLVVESALLKMKGSNIKLLPITAIYWRKYCTSRARSLELPCINDAVILVKNSYL